MVNPCTVCGHPAKHRCSRCSEGVDLDGHATSTWYCGTECQKPHWSTHKSECRSANLRKQLYRATDLLQASYYILARASWDYAEVKAERGVDGQLRLYTLSEPSHTFIGFPGFGLVGSEEKAVLAHCNTMAAVTKMANMVQQALKGTISAYEIVNVEPTLGPLIEWHPLRDDLSSHYLYRAKLADKSVWAIDLGGAIYGNTQPLMPWTSFANKYLTATIRTIPAGCMHWASDAEMIKVRAFVKREQTANGWAKNNILSGVRKELTDKALAASMSEEHGYRDLAELMKLSNVNFETAQQHFLEQLAANFAQEIEVFLAVGGVYSKLPAMLSGTSG